MKKILDLANFISATGCCVQEGIYSMAAFNPSSSFSRITGRGRARHRRAFGGEAVHGQVKMSPGLRSYSAVIGADQHKKKAVLCNKRSVFCNNIAARIEARKAKISATGSHGSTTCKITLPTRLPGQCASCNTATSSQLVSKRLRGGAAGSNYIEPDSRINQSWGIGPSSSANYTTNAIACYVGPRASQAGLHQAAASISNSAPAHHQKAATDVSSSSAGASPGVCGGYKITGARCSRLSNKDDQQQHQQLILQPVGKYQLQKSLQTPPTFANAIARKSQIWRGDQQQLIMAPACNMGISSFRNNKSSLVESSSSMISRPRCWDPQKKVYSSGLPNRLLGGTGGEEEDSTSCDEEEVTPGPGTYSPIGTYTTSPAYTMAARFRDISREDQPGPGTYDVRTRGFDGIAYSIPKYKRDMGPALMNQEGVPGPGTYDPNLVYANAHPAYSIAGKTRPWKGEGTPGPGQYEPRYKSAAPKFTIASGRRPSATRSMELSPGPGAYDAFDPYSTPAYTMAQRYYLKAEDDRSPGPAVYDIVRSVRGPAYTMRARHPQHVACDDADITPGPGAYLEPKPPYTPAYTIAARYKAVGMQLVDLDTPGPGAYRIAELSSMSPSYSFPCNKYDKKMNDIGPGPGAYDISAAPCDRSSPAYSITGKARPLQGDSDRTPGPGQYEPKKARRLSSPAYSMARRYHKHSPTDTTPGPSAYVIQDGRVVAPGPAYTIAGKNLVSAEGAESNNSPGPGAYDIATHYDSPAFSMARRYYKSTGSEEALIPGPGSYQPLMLPSNTAPAYTLGMRTPGIRGMENGPGPADYDPRDERLAYGPAYSFTAAHARGPLSLRDGNIGPGPGSYDLKDERSVASPAFTMARRYAARSQEMSPGPAAYCPSSQSTSPAYSIAQRTHRAVVFRGTTPGPGTYTLDVSDKTPAFTIGSRYPKKLIEDAPGPGTYSPNVSMLRSSPAYTMPSGRSRCKKKLRQRRHQHRD